MSFWNKQNKLILYHGSPIKEFTPEFGKGKDKHDYGKGFYLTEDNALYDERDMTARNKMRELIDSDANAVTKVFSTLV